MIGFGECQLVEDPDEVIHGLRLLTEHYGYNEYPFDRCGGMNHLFVGKIILDEVTGKRNLPGQLVAADKKSASENR